ncbi:TIGR04540 family protein [Alkalihalobacterium bogoriense]|uniref:TIGR04540 family protein n=1 Tax=Alkalihalobacterium bogoriense TaxID=246272 RepID=UPI00047D403C|nr:TIGR04540 family protein [Alkalihalobacterium bogoriense]
MEVKLFYKTQRDLAVALNGIVDAYWENGLDENELITKVNELFINNKSKVLKENEFTTVLRQQCGKRRLEVVERILTLNGHTITNSQQ